MTPAERYAEVTAGLDEAQVFDVMLRMPRTPRRLDVPPVSRGGNARDRRRERRAQERFCAALDAIASDFSEPARDWYEDFAAARQRAGL